MLQFTAIGHLGGDAQVNEKDGRKFVSFSVSDNNRWTDEAGTVHESINWISCTLDGDGGKLLPHLKRGRQVYVTGRGSVRVYSSEKERRMVAGANISVQRIELIGSTPEQVPGQLIDEQGVVYRTNKAYYVSEAEAKQIGATKKEYGRLHDKQGATYLVHNAGWIQPESNANAQSNTATSSADEVF